MADDPFFDDLFLPSLFAIFTSSLSSVVYVCYSLKLSKESSLWKRVMMMSLLLLSATAFALPATSSWKKDFLHQVGLVSEPVLWQRVLSGFVMAFKLTIDITDNYWITSQLLSFILPLVAFINMQRTRMHIPFLIVLAYLGLGLTGSYGGMLALFLFHFYNSDSTSASMSQLQRCIQLISTIGGCTAILLLGQATLSQLKIVVLPILCTIFALPFVSPGTSSVDHTPRENCFQSYFFIFLGIFLSSYHFYLSYLIFIHWISFQAFALVAFGHAYQYAISVDLISCMVISSVFITSELYLSNDVKFNSGTCRSSIIFRVLVVFLTVVLLTLIVSPAGVFSLFLGYREQHLVGKGFGKRCRNYNY